MIYTSTFVTHQTKLHYESHKVSQIQSFHTLCVLLQCHRKVEQLYGQVCSFKFSWLFQPVLATQYYWQADSVQMELRLHLDLSNQHVLVPLVHHGDKSWHCIYFSTSWLFLNQWIPSNSFLQECSSQNLGLERLSINPFSRLVFNLFELYRILQSLYLIHDVMPG